MRLFGKFGEVMIGFAGCGRDAPLCSPVIICRNGRTGWKDWAGTGACPYSLAGERKTLRWHLPLIAAAFLFLCCASVRADTKHDVVDHPLQREDFAYGMELTVSGNHAIYGLILPAAVYQGCTRADLGDLRVFNASHAVPHLLRTQIHQETERPAQTLPFFPLFSEGQKRGASPPDLRIS
ncbi:MAG: DUF3999 family protein, partial [Candidatus Electrothrix sp. AUS1_2]|nr:DUF3999 family protein [Candidatus Electrothrix sp. AUS1_2]